MKKLWRYNGYDPISRKIKEGFTYKNPEIFSEIQPDIDYTEVKSVIDIYNLTERPFLDYNQWRSKIRENLEDRGFNFLSNDEKDIVIKLDLRDRSIPFVTWQGIVATYLVEQGRNPQQELVNAVANHHVKDVESCLFRSKHPQVTKIVVKYLSLTNSAIFFRVVQNLFNQYQTQALKGTKDGLLGQGLFDFFESTPGTNYEFAGLEAQNFDINAPFTLAQFVNELMEWFRNGNIL